MTDANTTTTRWTAQTAHSRAAFAVRNLGVVTVRGTIPITQAWVEVDARNLPVCVHAELELAAIDTGNPRRDRDLAKPRLLDLANHPTLTFDGGPGVPAEAGVRVPGRLGARGRTADIVLDVAVTSTRIHAQTGIDRRDLGIKAPRFMIGRRIEVTIDAELSAD